MNLMSQEKLYLSKFLNPIKKCKDYKPKFGNSKQQQGYSLSDFSKLYGSDPFYSWIGLNSDLMYAAHRAAGGMTSIYRQIGIGCEQLFRQIVIDATGYEDQSYVQWSYTTKTKSGRNKQLSLDARLELLAIKNSYVCSNVNNWIKEYCSQWQGVQLPSKGVVFEIRQGYKSKDSKRQNADIDNATVAWANGYLPVFAIFSSQIDTDIVLRYQNNRCGILIGSQSPNPFVSLFSFAKNILGYDLAGFFQNHSKDIQKEIHGILNTLLGAKSL